VRMLAVLVLVMSVGAVPSAIGAESSPSFERTMSVSASGLAAVRLDRHVYEGARADLGDLRVVDGSGAAVPYALDRGLGARQTEIRPQMRNRGFTPDGSATVVLDFGDRLQKDRLVLRLTGDNFRRRVTVEGGDDGESWTRLTDDAWVFGVTIGGEARAYSLNLLNHHEVVNDTVGEHTFAAVW